MEPVDCHSKEQCSQQTTRRRACHKLRKAMQRYRIGAIMSLISSQSDTHPQPGAIGRRAHIRYRRARPRWNRETHTSTQLHCIYCLRYCAASVGTSSVFRSRAFELGSNNRDADECALLTTSIVQMQACSNFKCYLLLHGQRCRLFTSNETTCRLAEPRYVVRMRDARWLRTSSRRAVAQQSLQSH